ncbi:MAG: hypothetical protein ACM3NJ_00075 [Methanobacterium sp.]
MNGLILRVERHGENAVNMFQVPNNTEIDLLQRMVSRTMNWDQGPQGQPIDYQIEAQQLGRRLQAGEVLSQAGILDNFLLVFHNDNFDFSQSNDSTTGLLSNSAAEVKQTSAVDNSMAADNKAASVPDVPSSASVQPEPAVNPVTNQEAAPLKTMQQADANSTPVSGWRSLDIAVPPSIKEAPPSSEEEAQKSGFVWKQLD